MRFKMQSRKLGGACVATSFRRAAECADDDAEFVAKVTELICVAGVSRVSGCLPPVQLGGDQLRRGKDSVPGILPGSNFVC